VNGEAALDYWLGRLADMSVPHGPVETVDGRRQILFEDPEGQRLALIDDNGVGPAYAWGHSAVPPEFQIRGLGPVVMSVPSIAPSAAFLTDVMGMREARQFASPDADDVIVHVFEMGEGGPAAELQVRVEPGLAPHRPGAGSVHHVAFRVRDDEYEYWVDRLNTMRIRSSGPVDRYYFRSLYTREPGGILYEIATDGPGFAVDEDADTLGERLALPPFLEPQRDMIERGLKPL
jgi:glyoxalase family protein